jgi:hypothetical protein
MALPRRSNAGAPASTSLPGSSLAGDDPLSLRIETSGVSILNESGRAISEVVNGAEMGPSSTGSPLPGGYLWWLMQARLPDSGNSSGSLAPWRRIAGAIPFRRPAVGAVRSVDEISFTELRALASEMREAGHDQESGVLAMAREIGLRKLSAISRNRLERAWASLVGHSDPNSGA